ncbi:MAG: response regulator [Spirochaetaceae bacterium]|nr:response regulator [Spirochaetaceae bacterium]
MHTDSLLKYSKIEQDDTSLLPWAAPDAKVLIVDDVLTNLKVAEGFIAPFGVQTETVENAKDAIALIQQNDYDMVFMDQMMPEMDGIEAVAIIRSFTDENAGEKYKTLPIIALTANAMVGMREMFIENGFNEFLPKPIEFAKLSEIMETWIPEEKKLMKKKASDIKQKLQGIAGINPRLALSRLGGIDAIYQKSISNLVESFPEIKAAIEAARQKTENQGELAEQLRVIKGLLGIAGATSLNERALSLEMHAREGDDEYCTKHLNSFIMDAEELIKIIEKRLK